jgi:hypothetical protein
MSYSLLEKQIDLEKVAIMEDKTSPNRPPEEFFAFIKYSKYSRSKLIKTNRDVFIMSG